MRGVPPRYLAWMARDFALERGIPVLLVALLLSLPPAMLVWTDAAPVLGAERDRIVRALVSGAIPTILLLGTVLAGNGLVAGDRTHGYFRMLFSRPVSVPLYYATVYALTAAGFALVTALYLGIFSLAVHPVWFPGAVPFALLVWVAFGGLIFLASTLVRLDWLLAAILYMAGLVARQVRPPGSGIIGDVLNAVLPPSHLLERAGEAFLAGRTPETGSLAWLLAYGAAAFILGLIVLARRNFTE